jgi:hypothetical protein
MEYFLSAQHWLDAFPPPATLYCEQLCREVSVLLGAAAVPGADLSAAPSTPRPGLRAAFTDEELGSLQKRLAHHVGPVAGYLVKRAAASASSWTALTAQLAAEIEAPPARQAFLDGCRARP